MKLSQERRTWDQLARLDPMWAIVTDSAKFGRKWDDAQFFDTGRTEIADVLSFVSGQGIAIATDRALDFGCGIGRLTLPLSTHFNMVDGVDISAGMIDQAQRYVPADCNIRWHVNDHDDLRVFSDESFAFVYAGNVLQHIATPFMKRYMCEFYRIARRGGVVVFQLPVRQPNTLARRLSNEWYPRIIPRIPKALLRTYRRLKYRGTDRAIVAGLPDFPPSLCRMYGLDPSDVAALVRGCRARVFGSEQTADGGPTWTSFRYYTVKQP